MYERINTFLCVTPCYLTCAFVLMKFIDRPNFSCPVTVPYHCSIVTMYLYTCEFHSDLRQTESNLHKIVSSDLNKLVHWHFTSK